MSETKRRVAIWLVALAMLAATLFAFASANSATTHDARAAGGAKAEV